MRTIALVGVLFLGAAFAPYQAAAQTSAAKADASPSLDDLDPREAFALRGHKKDVWAVAFHPTGRTLASCDDDGQIILWDLTNRRETKRWSYQRNVRSIVFARRGDFFAVTTSGHWGGDAILRDGTDRTIVFTSNSKRGFFSVDIDPASQLVAAGGADSALRVWDVRRATFVKQTVETDDQAPRKGRRGKLKPPKRGRQERRNEQEAIEDSSEISPPAEALPAPIWTVTFDASPSKRPRSPIVAVGCKDGTIRTFVVADSGVSPAERQIEGHRAGVTCLRFSPDGRSLASSSKDGTIAIWDRTSGNRILTLQDSDEPVESIAYSPDGRVLASGHADSAVRIWDPTSGKQLSKLAGHSSPVLGVAFRPDGARLASSSSDFTVRVWDLFPGPKADK